MTEVHPNLFVGSIYDEEAVCFQSGWFIISACKFPHHKEALGYSGRAAPRDDPEYFFARRPGRLILNLVDADHVQYVNESTVDAAVDAIHENIELSRVLVHCNQGASRSPTIAFLYLLKHTDVLSRQSFDQDLEQFLKVYPAYEPKQGMSDYARLNWSKYVCDRTASTKL